MGSLGSAGFPQTAVTSSVGKHAAGEGKKKSCWQFQMPLHYPRYTKADYERMPEWKVDCLLKEYGLPVMGDVAEKRKFAMGSFLWPSQQ